MNEGSYLRPMAASFVVKHAYHAELSEFTERGPVGGEPIWECDHAHDTVDEAVECGQQHLDQSESERNGGRMSMFESAKARASHKGK